jgi:hypothetical protein
MSLSDTQTAINGALRAMTVDVNSGEVLVPVTPDVADEFNRNPRTIKRWIGDPKIGFPRPICQRRSKIASLSGAKMHQ